MDTTVIAATIAAIASILAAFITACSAAERRRDEERERLREQMNQATAESMLALLDAMDVSMLALEGGHLNGNVEEARASIKKAKGEYQAARSKATAHLL